MPMPINDETNMRDRIYFPELDGLRFFAFLLVFIHHHPLFKCFPGLSIFHYYGWIGVDLFFALSAFLFTKLLNEELIRTNTIHFKKFYIRRIFRIWPIYFLFVLFSVLFFVFVWHGELSKTILIRLVGLLTFSDNIVSSFVGYNILPFTAHLWTIAYEEQFYILIPAVIFLLSRASVRIKVGFLIVVIALFTLFRTILILNDTPHPTIWVLPITHFESILLGMVIGYGGFDFLLRILKPLHLFFLGTIFFFVLCMLPTPKNISHLIMVSYVLIGLSTSLVVFSVLHSNFLKNILSRDIFVFLGKRSYGLYVYHLFGISVSRYLIKFFGWIPSNHFATFLYALSFTIIASVLSYRLVESPFLKLKKRFEIVATRPI